MTQFFGSNDGEKQTSTSGRSNSIILELRALQNKLQRADGAVTLRSIFSLSLSFESDYQLMDKSNTFSWALAKCHRRTFFFFGDNIFRTPVS